MEDFNEMRHKQERKLLAENNPLQLHPETLDQLLAKDFPPREWLVDGLLAAQAMTLVSAAPNTFKTFLMLDMALSIAQGKRLFGELETQQANILIVDEESQDYGLYERFRKFNAPKGLPIWWLSRQGHKITFDGYVDSIISRCIEHDIGLVMFDSLTRMHESEENSSREMARVMDAFKRITDNGIAVLILHHTNKYGSSPENAIRGSSEIFAAPDSHIAMSRVSSSESIEVKQTKNRFKQPHKPFKIRLLDIEDEQVMFQLQEWLPTNEEARAKLEKEQEEAVLRIIGEQPGIHKKLIEEQSGLEERKLAALLKKLLADKKVVPGKRNRTLQPYYLNDGSVAETE